MKRLMVLAMVLLAGVSTVSADPAAEKLAENKTMISLADARSRIDRAIAHPKVLEGIMKHLSAEDQKQFLADLNKAISQMPGSVEEKTALFLNVNHLALTCAQPGNLATLVAEVFATVPPEALTVLNERFAIDLFNRDGNPNVTYTDADFTKIALDLMAKINERCEETDNGSTRSAFAILMLVRASNGAPADLLDKLVDTLKYDDAKELALKEWIPSALGKDGRQQNYEPLLASADAGRRPDLDFVLVIAGPQFEASILQDLFGKNNDPSSFMRTRTPVLDAVENPLIHQVPNFIGDLPIIDDSGDKPLPQKPLPPPQPPEPGPYPWQSSGRN